MLLQVEPSSFVRLRGSKLAVHRQTMHMIRERKCWGLDSHSGATMFVKKKR